jgi:hypothetical protein
MSNLELLLNKLEVFDYNLDDIDEYYCYKQQYSSSVVESVSYNDLFVEFFFEKYTDELQAVCIVDEYYCLATLIEDRTIASDLYQIIEEEKEDF